jgi:hypothetical protein
VIFRGLFAGISMESNPNGRLQNGPKMGIILRLIGSNDDLAPLFCLDEARAEI